MRTQHSYWYDVPADEVASKVFDYVSAVETEQCELFDRFIKLQYLYDPNDYWAGRTDMVGTQSQTATQRENVVASNVDTVVAAISATEVRARFLPDDGDWSTQRQARRKELYAEGLDKRYDIHVKARHGFKDGAIKGTAMVKVYPDHDSGEICIERTLVDDIVVDEGECRTGQPRQMHHRVFVDRAVLIAKYPRHEAAIRAAHDRGSKYHRWWADYRPITADEVVAIESYKLPSGAKGTKTYRPGRWTLCVDGATLFDRKWEKGHFPFARFVWAERTSGWYGLSLAERVSSFQRALNKRNWQIDRQLDQHAVPTTYVRLPDANLAVKTTNRLGTIAVYKSDIPKTVIPPAVSAETYQDREYNKNASYEESGVSRLAASARKPAGLESGAALREYRDQTTQRFALQEKAYERFILDIIWLALEAAKDLGEKAPEIIRIGRYGKKPIRWSEVDMGETRVQMHAASPLARTPAGRRQLVLEMAQAGIISTDSARRLMQLEDTEHEMSLYVAALEDLERTFEEILDGGWAVPEPFQNLQMGIWRGTQTMLKARADGAPEEVLEALRQWIDQAAWMLAQAEQPQEVAEGPALEAPPDEMMGAMPPGGAELPPAAGPAPAILPEAGMAVA